MEVIIEQDDKALPVEANHEENGKKLEKEDNILNGSVTDNNLSNATNVLKHTSENNETNNKPIVNLTNRLPSGVTVETCDSDSESKSPETSPRLDIPSINTTSTHKATHTNDFDPDSLLDDIDAEFIKETNNNTVHNHIDITTNIENNHSDTPHVTMSCENTYSPRDELLEAALKEILPDSSSTSPSHPSPTTSTYLNSSPDNYTPFHTPTSQANHSTTLLPSGEVSSRNTTTIEPTTTHKRHFVSNTNTNNTYTSTNNTNTNNKTNNTTKTNTNSTTPTPNKVSRTSIFSGWLSFALGVGVVSIFGFGVWFYRNNLFKFYHNFFK